MVYRFAHGVYEGPTCSPRPVCVSMVGLGYLSIKLHAIFSYQKTRALYFSKEYLVLSSGEYEYFDTSVNELWLLFTWQWKLQNMWICSVRELRHIATKWHAWCWTSNNISNDRVAYGVRTLIFFLEYSGPRTSMDKINSGSIMLYNNERLCKHMLGWQEHAMRYAAINGKYRASPRLIVSNNISKTENINRGFQCLYSRGKTFPEGVLVCLFCFCFFKRNEDTRRVLNTHITTEWILHNNYFLQ